MFRASVVFSNPCLQIDLSSSPSSARLVVTRNTHRELPYATLSHRWGSGVRLIRTMKGNLEEHQQAIPLDKLPRTYLDAMRITWNLCLHHLCIDSLA
jgi:hypothetical protein